INSLGVSEPVITPQGADRILVQIPAIGQDEIAKAKAQLQKVAKLEFKYVSPDSKRMIAAIDAGETIVPPNYEIKTYKESNLAGKIEEVRVLVKKEADLGGEHVTSAYP